MLPFLKSKQDVSGASDSSPIIREHDDDSNFDAVELVVEDMHQALQSKNYKAAAKALRSAYQILDSEPHEEGPHE